MDIAINQKIGHLTILNIIGKGRILCKCDCGEIFYENKSVIASEHKKSCGCNGSGRKRSIIRYEHGHARRYKQTTEYKAYHAMKSRCYNTRSRAYKNYGGRGIVVCDRWLESFDNFFEDMGPKPGKEYSLERVKVNGNYEPSNCKWATEFEQARNRRHNKWIEYDGRKMVLADWARLFNVRASGLNDRLRKGYSMDMAIAELASIRDEKASANATLLKYQYREGFCSNHPWDGYALKIKSTRCGWIDFYNRKMSPS